MLPTDLAAALRQELDSCEGLRVGWEAVADGNLLALLHRDAADECQWGALVPHLAGRHTYMATPPLGPRSREGEGPVRPLWGWAPEAEWGRAPCDRRGAGPQKPSGAGPRATAEGLGSRSRVGQGPVRPPWGWAREGEWGRAPCDHRGAGPRKRSGAGPRVITEGLCPRR